MYTRRYRDQETSRPVVSSMMRAYVRARLSRASRPPGLLLLETSAAPAGLTACPRCRGIPLGRYLGAMPPGNCPVCWHRWGRTTPLSSAEARP